MASKKSLSADITVKLLERLADGQDRIADRLDETNERLERVVRNTADTADGVRRLEQSAVGVDRVIALEERVRKLEEHIGVEPPR